MPRGLYALIDRELAEAEASGGYLRLADAAGGAPWLAVAEVATATSRVMVGVIPMREDYVRTLEPIYDEVAAVERAAIEAGSSRRSATNAGAKAMVERILDLGFSGYRDLTNTAIPAETLMREVRYEQPSVGPLAVVWEVVEELATRIDGQTAAQDRLFDLTTTLVLGARGLTARGEAMGEAAAQAAQAARGAGASASALTVAGRVSFAAEAATVRLGALAQGVEQCQSLVLEQRSLLAIARLLTQAVMETASSGQDLPVLTSLAAALGVLGPAMAMGSARSAASLTRLARDAGEAAGQARIFASAAEGWSMLAERMKLGGGDLPQELKADALGDSLDGLRDLARGAHGKAREVDPTAYQDAVADLTRALHRLR
jgi:hypothetical protein